MARSSASSALSRLAPTLGRAARLRAWHFERTRRGCCSRARLASSPVTSSAPAGQIRITATEEDLSTGKSLRIVTAAGTSPMAALEPTRSPVFARARPAPTSNRGRPCALGHSLSNPLRQRHRTFSIRPFASIRISAPPGLRWPVSNLARGDRAAARTRSERARHHKLDRDQPRRPRSGCGESESRIAPPESRRCARLRPLSPADTLLLRSLAEAEIAAGQFEAAAADWKKIDRRVSKRSVGMEQPRLRAFLRGRLPGRAGGASGIRAIAPQGRESVRLDRRSELFVPQIRRSRRQLSRGAQEAARFPAATAIFTRPPGRNFAPATSQARMHSSLSFAPNARRQGLPTGSWTCLAADWLYRTGREREAVAALRKVVAETPVRASSHRRLRADRRYGICCGAIARKPPKTQWPSVPKPTSPPVFGRRASRRMPSAPAAEWEARAERMIPPSVMALRRLALGYALLLDGKREAALPVWEQIVEDESRHGFLRPRGLRAPAGENGWNGRFVPDPRHSESVPAVLDKL